MSTILTEKCFKTLSDRLSTLKYSDAPKAAEYLEECRVNGSLDDNVASLMNQIANKQKE